MIQRKYAKSPTTSSSRKGTIFQQRFTASPRVMMGLLLVATALPTMTNVVTDPVPDLAALRTNVRVGGRWAVRVGANISFPAPLGTQESALIQSVPLEAPGRHWVEDTAVLITSSWIPSHPSTEMIDTTINSLTHIRGLSPSAPIFVHIDQLPALAYANANSSGRRAALDKYAMNMHKKYLLSAHIHIIASMNNGHISRNVFKGLRLIELHFPTVEFVYSLQHDFEFVRNIDHLALTQTMREHGNVNYIRFKYKGREDNNRFRCGNTTSLLRVGQSNKTIFSTSKYCDYNHLVRFKWYQNEVIGMIGSTPRPPEYAMKYKAPRECKARVGGMGLFTYGKPGAMSEAPVIRHLDGRNGTSDMFHNTKLGNVRSKHL